MTSPAHSVSSEDVEKKSFDGQHVDAARYEVKEETPETFYVNKYGALGPFMQKLFKHGVEARGVERVPEDQRTPKNSWNK